MSRADHLINVCNFLFWLEREDSNQIWGGVRIYEALESLRVLLGFDDVTWERLRQIALEAKDLAD